MSRSAAAFLILLSLAAMVAAAQAPAPAAVDDGSVVGYGWQADDRHCSGYDPVFGVVGLAFPSRVSHEAVDGGTRYDLHLESLVADAACPPLDISFVTGIAAWPEEDAYAPVSAPCGLRGDVAVYVHPEGRSMQGFLDVPEACGMPVTGFLYFGVGMSSVHPSAYMACAPVYALTVPCAGVGEANHEGYRCTDGRHYESTYVPLLVGVHRHCDWETGESVVVVSPLSGLVTVEARATSCEVVVRDPLVGAEDRAPCPAEAGSLLFGADWGDLLP